MCRNTILKWYETMTVALKCLPGVSLIFLDVLHMYAHVNHRCFGNEEKVHMICDDQGTIFVQP